MRDAIDAGGVQGHIGAVPLLDVDYTMTRLAELVEILPHAPAYPLDGFATLVDLLTPSLRDHPLYRQVCDGIDDAIRRQVGEVAVAERCRQRAMALIDADRPLEALREFHEAKAKWFHGDTLSDSLQAVGAIANIYDYLGMHSAAKRYSLGLAALAATSADHHDRLLVPMAIFAASISDHNAGAWVSSADLASIAGLAHVAYWPNPFDLNSHEYVLEGVARQVITMAAAKNLRPDVFTAIAHLFDENPLAELVATGLTDAIGEDDVRSDEALFEMIRSDVGDPFSDVGPERYITFHALGVSWSIHGANDENTVLAMEDFASTLQILIVEVASDDAVIIPGDIDIEIRVSADSHHQRTDSRTRMANERRQWLFLVPPDLSDEVSDASRRALYARAFVVLRSSSLLDDEQFASLMQRIAGSGVFQKFEIGHRSYRHLAQFRPTPRILLRREAYGRIGRTRSVAGQQCSPHLSERCDPGRGYTSTKAESILAERYELLPRAIRITLPELMADHDVRQLFRDLKELEGWKDWHLMSVVMNLTVSHRIAAQYGPITVDNVLEHAEEFHKEALREEVDSDARIGPEVITRHAMEAGILAVAISSLKRWGLSGQQHSNRPTALLQVLADRYGFWDDDISHRDLFASSDT